MGLIFRDATPEETKTITRQWASSFEPSWPKGDKTTGITVGSPFRSIHPGLWRRAHRDLVEALLIQSSVEVLVLEDVPSEPLGWVSFDPILHELHYVYVVDKARRRGLGRMLVTRAREHGCSGQTHLTAGGAGLLRGMGEAL
jgi:GNAT superfamily N-acetyltransferase